MNVTKSQPRWSDATTSVLSFRKPRLLWLFSAIMGISGGLMFVLSWLSEGEQAEALDAVSAAAWLAVATWYWSRPFEVMRIDSQSIRCPQPRANAPDIVHYSELASVAWDQPRSICFETRSGQRFVLDLRRLKRSERRQVRERLSEELPELLLAPQGQG